jgi:tetratricopeptide (TPR) repeat protein
VAPDGRTVILHLSGGVAEVREVTTGKLLRQLAATAGASRVVQSRDGKMLAAARPGATVRLVNPTTDKAAGEWKADAQVLALTFCPTGARLVTASADRRLRLWQVPDGKRLRVWGPFDTPATYLAFSADGRRLALASEDGTIRLIRPEEADTGLVLRGHSGAVTDLRFHPAGNRLVSCGRDRTVRLWDVETGQETLTLPEMSHMAYSVDFDPKGQRIAAVDHAGMLMIYSSGEGPAAGEQARRRKQIEEQTRRWQRAEGEKAWIGRQWFSAEWFFDRLVGSGETDPALFAYRGLARGEQGKWAASRDDLARAWKDGWKEVIPGSSLALLHHRARDDKAHRRLVAELLEQHAVTKDPLTANAVAWVSVRFAGAVDDLTQPLRLARLAVDRMPRAPAEASAGLLSILRGPKRNPAALNTLGAALCRAKQYREARQHLEEAIQSRGSAVPEDWLFLARAEMGLGNKVKAQSWLARVLQWRQKQSQSAGQEGAALAELELKLLQGEAEGALDGMKEVPTPKP